MMSGFSFTIHFAISVSSQGSESAMYSIVAPVAFSKFRHTFWTGVAMPVLVQSSSVIPDRSGAVLSSAGSLGAAALCWGAAWVAVGAGATLGDVVAPPPAQAARTNAKV